DGRLAEDFKLTTATWVDTSSPRVKGIEALTPLVQDIVVTGHDRDTVGFMISLNSKACCELRGMAPDTSISKLAQKPTIKSNIESGLRQLEQNNPGSSTYADRAFLLDSTPSVDAGEITDKGYINQAAVLKRRADLLDLLYSDAAHPAIIRL